MNRRKFTLGTIALAAAGPAVIQAQTPVATPYVIDSESVVEAWGRTYSTEEVDLRGTPFVYIAQSTIFTDDADSEALTEQMHHRYPLFIAEGLETDKVDGPEPLDVASDVISGDLKAYRWLATMEEKKVVVSSTVVTVTDGPRSLILLAGAFKDVDPADLVAIIEPSYESWTDSAESLIPPIEDFPEGVSIDVDEDVTDSISE